MKRSKTKTFLVLFWTFFKAGTFTFAGGLAMLPVIEKSLTVDNELLTKDEFMEYASLAQTLPGIIALNCASFVGKHVAGIPGMLIAGFGATISAFVLMIAATIALQFIPKTGPLAGAMSAIRASSAALILSAALSLGKHNIKTIFSVVVMIAAFVLVYFLKVSTPIVVLLAAAAGIIYYVKFLKNNGGKKDE